jgi:UDP-glucose 4-epimerase
VARIEGQRVLVTGGAGLIGSWITEQLAEHSPAEVVVLDNFERGRMANLATVPDDMKLTVVEGDIRDVDTVRHVMEGIDLVFHLAALRITQCAEEPRTALETLVDGTFNIAEAAQAAGVQKCVISSTASVYGDADILPTREDHHPYNNRTLYGAAKTFNELLFRSFNDMYGLDYIALRYFNVYGPRMDIHGLYTEVLIRWMERIVAGEAPIIFGDGAQTMDFVCAPDIGRANLLAMTSELSDRVYNVASGHSTSLLELARALMKVMGSDLDVEFGPERAINGVRDRQADISAARDDLGFVAEIDLETGLRMLVDWWRAEQAD